MNKHVTKKETINNNFENCTPISIDLEKDNTKMIPFLSVKNVLDIFTNSFIDYGNHLYLKYIQENGNSQYEDLMEKSYLRNVRFLIKPNWSDMNKNYEYPDHSRLDGLNQLFYMISEEKKNSWIFQPVCVFEEDSELNDETIFEAFNALLDGVYHEEFMKNNDKIYHYFIYYMDMLKHILNKNSKYYIQNIYQIGSLLQIKDGISSLNQPYTNLESCIATKNFIMGINSLTIMKNSNISRAIAYMGLDNNDIKIYIKCILTPFFGIFYALCHLNKEDYIYEIDDKVYNNMCVTNPLQSWIEEKDENFDEEAYRKERENIMKLHRAKRLLEEESRKREFDNIKINYVNTPAPLLNKRFVEKLEQEKSNPTNPTNSLNSRASSFASETNSIKNSPTSSISSQHINPLTNVAHDFVFEHDKIPKSMKRNEKSDVNGRDEGFLLFYYGTASDTVYERCAFYTPNGNCSIKEACIELPRLLVEKERFLRTSKNTVFKKSLEDLFQTDIKKRSFYYTNIRRAVISFCNEISATSRNDNTARMEIIQAYYGQRREGETERMYINSFMFDVFRPFVNFYTFVRNK